MKNVKLNLTKDTVVHIYLTNDTYIGSIQEREGRAYIELNPKVNVENILNKKEAAQDNKFLSEREKNQAIEYQKALESILSRLIF